MLPSCEAKYSMRSNYIGDSVLLTKLLIIMSMLAYYSCV